MRDDQVLDVFSGPGGLGTGFSRFFPVVQAVDINPDCCRTYSFNHPGTDVRNRDVRGMDFIRKDYEGVIGVVGGPPCQDFSRLNVTRDVGSARAHLLPRATLNTMGK